MPQLLLILLCLLASPAWATASAGLAFVPSRLVPEVAVIDTRADAVLRRLPTGTVPLHAAVSASQDLLVTTSWRGRVVNLIDVAGILPTETVALDVRPDGIALDPAGRILAVSSLEQDAVALVDLAARRQTATIAGLATPHHLAFSADGTRLYVGNLGADRVSEIDVAGGVLLREIELAPAGGERGGVTNLTLLPDRRRALAVFGSGAELALIDLAAGQVAGMVPVGELPWHAFATMDGARIVVPNRGEETVSLLDGASLREIARVPVAGDVADVSFAWFESAAFVLGRGARKVTVIDLAGGAVLAEIDLPGAPEAAVAAADGGRVYVALADLGAVAVIDARERRLVKVIDGVARRPWGVQMAGASNYCR